MDRGDHGVRLRLLVPASPQCNGQLAMGQPGRVHQGESLIDSNMLLWQLLSAVDGLGPWLFWIMSWGASPSHVMHYEMCSFPSTAPIKAAQLRKSSKLCPGACLQQCRVHSLVCQMRGCMMGVVCHVTEPRAAGNKRHDQLVTAPVLFPLYHV